MKDVIKPKGSAAFGTRLRRLSERLDRQIEMLYRANGVDFQPRWYPVITALIDESEASVGELASMIGITHPADRRRQLLALSAKGRRYAETLTPLWRAIAAATDDLLAEVAPDLLRDLAELEAALDAEPMIDRIA